MTTCKHVFKLRPDKVDKRDIKFKLAIPQPGSLPPFADLTSLFPPVVNQATLGSCTGNGIAAALDYAHKKSTGMDFAIFSRLFIYYLEREMEGTINEDAGASIRDGIKCVVDKGAPPESLWPYDISKFTQKPPQVAYDAAMNFQALKYYRIDTPAPSLLKSAIAQGYPVVGGIKVFESLESEEVSKTGMLKMPRLLGDPCLGGHCIVFVGYDDARQLIKVRNSWGVGWGDKGYFYMPYKYFIKYASDLWVISLAE